MYTMSNMTSTNGIHKDWETLPPLKNPDDLLEKPAKLKRYEKEHPLITEEEYKKMELNICPIDQEDALDLEDWGPTIYAQEQRDAAKKR